MKKWTLLGWLLAGFSTCAFAQEAAKPAVPQKAPVQTEKAEKADKPEKAEKAGMEITASKEVDFDSAGHKAVFLGEVNVRDPQFQLKAAKLTVYLAKNGDGLERAEAEGNVTIVSERATSSSPDTKPTQSSGKGERAVYDPKTGDITLTGWPQIQQGINMHIATEAGTRMILNKDGRMKTFGQSKTIIKDRKEE